MNDVDNFAQPAVHGPIAGIKLVNIVNVVIIGPGMRMATRQKVSNEAITA